MDREEILSQEEIEALLKVMGDSEVERKELILDIPIKVIIEIGPIKMLLTTLSRLNQANLFALEHLAGEPLKVLINDILVARGEIVRVNDKLSIRLLDVVTKAEWIKRL